MSVESRRARREEQRRRMAEEAAAQVDPDAPPRPDHVQRRHDERARIRQRQMEEAASGEQGDLERSLRTILMGDFYDNPTITGLVIRATITAIPFVDQAADLQDTAAWVILVRDCGLEDFGVKLNGFLLFVGFIPSAGSVAKGVLRAVTDTTTVRALLEILNHMGRGHGVRYLRELSDDIPNLARQAAQKARDMLDELERLMTELLGYVPRGVAETVLDWLRTIRRLRDYVLEMFTEAADYLKRRLDEALAAFRREELDLPTETRTEAVRVQEARHPPGAAAAARTAGNMQLSPQQVDDAITSRYGAHLDDSRRAGGLAGNNMEFLDDDAFRRAYAEGGDVSQIDNIDGYYDPNTGRQVINADRSYADATMLHESLHAYSSPQWRDAVPTGFNEGVTEYLTGVNSRELGIDFSSGYPSSTWQAERVARVVGDDTLARAYFTGDMDGLRRAYEANHLGGDPATWDGLLQQFDSKYARDVGG